MADKTIGELPSVANVTDGTLVPVEQNGIAAKMTGAQFRSWAEAGASPYATAAEGSASAAAGSASAAADQATAAGNQATAAAGSAAAAEAARQAIEDMGVAGSALDPGSQATVVKTVSTTGVVTLTFGIPRGATGAQGAQGPQGAQGVQGPKGDTGTAAVVETAGMYNFYVDNDTESATYGHLMLVYVGNTAPDFYIAENGHLMLNLD